MTAAALVVCSLDGLQSQQTGVGTVVRSFVQHSEAIVGEALPGGDWSLWCGTGMLQDDAAGLDADLRRTTRDVCRRSGGDLVELASLTDGHAWSRLFVGPRPPGSATAQWGALSRAAAAWMLDLAESSTQVLGVLHDTPFAGVAAEIARAALEGREVAAARIRLVWVPHSLGVDFPDLMAVDRVAFEEEGIRALRARGDVVGFVSDHYRDLLMERCGAEAVDLVPLRNVVDTAAHWYQPGAGVGGPLSSVPADARIVFSWGRCKPQKSFDELLRGFRVLLETTPGSTDHLVLLAPTATTEPAYLETVDELLAALPPERVTVLRDFDPHLPTAVLGDPRLRAVVLASRFEAFGLVAAEASAFAGSGTWIVHSPIPTFDEILASDPRAVRLPEISASAICEALRAVALGPAPGAAPSSDEEPGRAFVDSQVAGLRATSGRRPTSVLS